MKKPGKKDKSQLISENVRLFDFCYKLFLTLNEGKEEINYVAREKEKKKKKKENRFSKKK